MTGAVETSLLAGPGLRVRGLGRGLAVFVWLLPIHILAIAFLFGAAGVPGTAVRILAAWKELLVAALFVAMLARVGWRAGPTPPVHWLDLAVGGIGLLAFAYLIGADVWFDTGLPLGAQLYGIRDTAFVSLLYFVGRATPEVVDDRRLLRALFVVGVVTSAIAILERLFVTPAMLVLLGASRYIQDFLGASALTTGNVYGLPDNYWTQLGSQIVRRVGSTYLSAQGFAIPFLVVLPAATLWLWSATRHRVLASAGYALLWVALLLTITRTTIVACLAQTLILAAWQRRWRWVLGWCAAALGALGTALFVFPGFAAFVWGTLTWQTGSSQSHLLDWGTAVDNLIRYPLGAGLGSTDQNAVRYGLTPLASDNQYFKFALELGIPGLLLHVAMLAGILVAGTRAALRAASETSHTYGLLLAVAAIGIAVNELTAVVANSMMLTYVFLWLAGATVTVLDRGAAAPVRP